jgi:hypothetical protein
MRARIQNRSWGGGRRSLVTGVDRGLAACAAALGTMLSLTGAAVSAGSRPVNYCQAIPYVTVTPEMWGFHAGHPITGATGSYARGHGYANLSAHTAKGNICQVNRPRHKGDREIILTVGHRFNYSSHYAIKWGVPGNIIQLNVRVRHSTDPRCRVGTWGQVTIFASYNGVHRDSVQFSFPAACATHRRLYKGLDVVTNVPPN